MVRFGGFSLVKSVEIILTNQLSMPTDNFGDNKDTTQSDTKIGYYMVRHNETIVGFFDNENDATNSMNGYFMDNNIEIDDVLDILKIV